MYPYIPCIRTISCSWMLESLLYFTKEFAVKISDCWSPRESINFNLWLQPVLSRWRDLSPLCNAVVYNIITYTTFCPTTILELHKVMVIVVFSVIFSIFASLLPCKLLPALPCWRMHVQQWRCYQGLRHHMWRPCLSWVSFGGLRPRTCGGVKLPFPCCGRCWKSCSLKGCELKDHRAAPRAAGDLPWCHKPSAQLFSFSLQ